MDSTGSDLLDHFKLDAEVGSQYTVHRTYKSDPNRGVRKQRVETRWYRDKLLGQGAFGQVWLEVDDQGNDASKKRAVKLIDKGRMRSFNIDYKREISALAKFSKSQYRQEEVFVQFHGWFENTENVFLAMEYLSLGDLNEHIDGTITEEEIKQITTDVLTGLEIMHREGFTHRDLKPQNIFVVQKPPASPTWWVKIGDFGITKRVRSEETALQTRIGTPHFQAPEITGHVEASWECTGYDSAVDIWSLGCVIYKISTNEVPFPTPHALARFCAGKMPFPEQLLATKLSAAGVELTRSFLDPLPDQRPTAQGALRAPWLELGLDSRNSLDQTVKFAGRPDNAGTEALLNAASNGNEETVRLLLEKGTALEAKDDEGSSVLQIAACNGHESIVRLLLEKGAALEAKDDRGSSALQFAAFGGNEETVRLLLEKGAALEARDDSGSSALQIAALNGHESIVRLLLEKGAALEAKDDEGLSALHFAASNGHKSIVRLLLEKGAALEAKSDFGWSALQLAAFDGHESIVRLLLEKGVALDAKNYIGSSSLHYAASHGYESIVRLLLEKGADLEARDGWGDSALHCAALRGHLAIVHLLLDEGANANAKELNGETPLDLATKKGHEEVAKLLMAAGSLQDQIISLQHT